MNSLSLFLLAIALPLFLGGCGEKIVTDEEVEERDGLIYLYGSTKPFSGTMLSFWDNKNKMTEKKIKDGKADGLFIGYHMNGQKGIEVNYKNEKRVGPYLEWHDNGHKKEQSIYNNVKKKAEKRWNKNGEPELIQPELELRLDGLNYLEGENIPYSGKRSGIYKSGQKSFEKNYLNGKLHVLWTSWHKNGKKMAEEIWKDGKPDGLWILWYDNGQKENELIYEKGKIVQGSRKFWDKSGKRVN